MKLIEIKHLYKTYHTPTKEVLSLKDINLTINKEEIINSEIYKKSKKIFTYISFGSEVDTIKLIKY